MLRAQYRCPPLLSSLASRLFYGGQLRDGLGDGAAAARAPLLPGLPTLGFCEVRGAERVEERDGGSISNGAEAARAVRLLGALRGCGVEPSQVGVVCLYRAQAALVTRLLLDAGLDGHTVSTVDAFQGAERDIIVVSGCRTSASSLGFVGVPTRFNVTITRARHHLLVLGTANALMGDPLWAELITMSEAIPANFLAGAPTPGAAAAAAARPEPPPPAAAAKPFNILAALSDDEEDGGGGGGGGPSASAGDNSGFGFSGGAAPAEAATPAPAPAAPPAAPSAGATAGSELLEDDEEALDLLQW